LGEPRAPSWRNCLANQVDEQAGGGSTWVLHKFDVLRRALISHEEKVDSSCQKSVMERGRLAPRRGAPRHRRSDIRISTTSLRCLPVRFSIAAQHADFAALCPPLVCFVKRALLFAPGITQARRAGAQRGGQSLTRPWGRSSGRCGKPATMFGAMRVGAVMWLHGLFGV
jgi:hypothetical protein